MSKGKVTCKGYKVFNPDWTCKGFKYKVGKTYTYDGEIRICQSGFHFCTKAIDCFNYYDFNPKNKVAEVEAIGHLKTHNEDSKIVTDKIHIIREIKWTELLEIVNIGSGNTGHSNSGNRNSGYSNSGNRNSGYSNSGNRNSGASNSGYSNSGYSNSGDSNSGDRNSGYSNSGYSNSGNRNSGDRNSGYSNSGDFNSCNFSSGIFNSQETTIMIFNQPSHWLMKDWWNSKAFEILQRFTIIEWISEEDMKKKEKKEHPEYETIGGYLKTLEYKEAWEKFWKTLTKAEKKTIMNLPNFNKKIFKEITGVTIRGVK